MNTKWRLMRLVFVAFGGGIAVVLVFAMSWSKSGNHQTVSSHPHDNESVSDPRSAARPNDAQSNEPHGEIEGTVLFRGKIRKWPPSGGRLSEIVVYLNGNGLESSDDAMTGTELSKPKGESTRKIPIPAVAVLDQFDMTFFPHIVLLQKGDTLELRNSDSVLHNVNGSATLNQAFNVALSPGSKAKLVLRRHEFIRVSCNFHSRMSAWIAVMPNRFFTKVNEQGRFSLSDIPPGEYTLRGWHEDVYPPYTSHQVSMGVRVQPERTAVLELDFP